MPTTIHNPIAAWRADQLGRLVYVEKFLERLSDPDCASVIGLYGGWGTGKTSFLQMAQDYYAEFRDKQQPRLELSLQIVDAWLYEQTGNLVTPILARLQKMAGNAPSAQDIKALSLKVLAVTGLTVTDLILRGVSRGDYTLEDIDKHLQNVEAREERRLKLVDTVDEARSNFQAAVEKACQAVACNQIVFMIDNLDRCFPDNVVALLESIKNVLSSSERCVWVLAIDPDVVASYIDQKYKGTSMDGHSYLDKIVPEQFHLPLPSLLGDRYSVAAFLQRFLKPGQEAGLPLDAGVLLQLPRTLVPRRLIKAARKYSELAQPGRYAFGLILLYYSWPAFYRWLSVDNADHIGGVLANFFVEPPFSPTTGDTPIGKTSIPESFVADRELALFLDSLLLRAARNPSIFRQMMEDVRRTILQLREIGLP